MHTRAERLKGWKPTATGRFLHKPKDRFPEEAICGLVLSNKETTGLEPCIRCMNIEAKRRKVGTK